MDVNHHIIVASDGAEGANTIAVALMIIVTVIGFLIFSPECGRAEPMFHGLPGMPGGTDHFAGYPRNKSMIEGRVGYMWGVTAFQLRDGDNDNLLPGKKEVSLESPIFGIQGETRAITDDLAIRVQGWINLHQTTRGDFMLGRSDAGTLTARSWETESGFLGADVAAIYHLGPFGSRLNHMGSIGMPYTAGLVAGFRYMGLDFKSVRSTPPTGTFDDHYHIYIPYIGVHYAHEHFVGSLVRLDILASPFTLSSIDAERQLTGVITRIEGDSVTGFWFESLFSWSKPVSDGTYIGMFVNYDYLELSGGATVDRAHGGVLNSTRFSMDSISHLIMVGITGIVTF